MTDAQIAELGKIPAILDGTFFKIVKIKNGKISAKCVSCQKEYSGSLQVTSNYTKHLKDKHHTLVSKYESHKKTYIATSSGQQIQGNQELNTTAQSARAATASMFHKGWQKKSDDLVTNLIVNNALYLHMVEYPEFKELVEELSKMPEPVHCLSTKKLSKCIDERYTTMRHEIIQKLKTTNFVCTTADVWSSRRRSFIGVTVHWLNHTFERESYAIACTRFKGTHDFKSIAKILGNTHESFGLCSKKVVFTVTDNASNMVKAFKEFGIVTAVPSSVADELEQHQSDADGSDEDEITQHDILDDDDDDVENVCISDMPVPEDIDVSLPKHIRCASHTLSLIVTADIQKAINSKSLTAHNFSINYRIAMSRCSLHWNLLSRSPNKASESFITKFGKFVRLPCPTRWNSLYDALTDLMALDSVLLREFSNENKLVPLSDVNRAFLKEFVECLRPIAIALDTLQGEKSILMAEVIPCILNTHFLLNKLKHKEDVKFCKDLIQLIMNQLQNRFSYIFNWDQSKEDSLPYVMATVTSPKLKLRWIDSAVKKEIATKWLLEEAQSFELASGLRAQPLLEEAENVYEFFSSEECTVMETETLANLQVVQFFNEKITTYATIQKYPLIEQVFFKYNAGNILIFNIYTNLNKYFL